MSRTVRDAAFDVLRERGLTTLFANPGSTEVSLLAGLPDDLRFVLALHEGSVIGMATGYAIGRGEPAMAILHTTAGLGNARRARSPPRASTARRSSCSSASRTAATSCRSRSWPGACAAWPASTRSPTRSRCARRTCRARSPAPTTRRARARARARHRADGRLAGARARAARDRRAGAA